MTADERPSYAVAEAPVLWGGPDNPDELTGWFSGKTEEDARAAAVEWWKAEPNIAGAVISGCLRAVGGFPPFELPHTWAITLAVIWRVETQDGLGL